MNNNKIVLSNVFFLITFLSILFTTISHATDLNDCDKSSCNDIGNQYYADENIETAIKFYTKGCELNNSDSCYNIATIFDHAYYVERDFLRASTFYKKSCNLKDTDACTDLADEYDDLEDYANALVYYDAACKLNDGYGCGLQAWILVNHISPIDLEQATALYAKGCKLEHGSSCNNLGYDYMGYDDEPNPYAPKDYVKGIELMLLACDTYDVGSACTSLSYAYEHGHGVKKNLPESFRYSVKACEGTDDDPFADGCAATGMFYDSGDGVKKDIKKAQYYLEKGCELGSDLSCWNAAVFYEVGNGRRIKESTQKAQYFYQKACDFGDEDGCKEVTD